MSGPRLQEPKEKWHIPPIGQRIVKTTVAVFLCLLIYYLRGYQGQDMPTESSITAIICMQPYVRDTRDYALNRLAGTLVGAFWGLALLLLLWWLPDLSGALVLVYALMALGVLLSLYSAVLLGKADASSLAAIVFLCIVVAFPEIRQPLVQAVNRVLDIFIGTVVAVAVNLFRLPRVKRRDQVFFVRTRDLAPDRFSPISPALLFRLNYLYDDGARICLMSEHAPAFFVLQMSMARLKLPLIVMDGAAIYDTEDNRYLQVQTIAAEDSARLRRRLEELGLGCFIYTVHNNKTCIFHQGEMSEDERLVYDRLRRSPFRSYLEGEIYDPDEIVYLKVIARDEGIAAIEHRLRSSLPRMKLRAVIRPQAGTPGISALYIYAHTATMEQAQKRLMAMLHEKEPELVAREIRLQGRYRSERDGLLLLNRLGNAYEPVAFLRRAKK